MSWEISFPWLSLNLESHLVSSQDSEIFGSQDERAKLSWMFPVFDSASGKETHWPNLPVWESEGRSMLPPWTAATVTVAETSSRVMPCELTYIVIGNSMLALAFAGTVICNCTLFLSQFEEELQCLPSIVTYVSESSTCHPGKRSLTPMAKLSWPLPVFVIIIDVDAVEPGSALLMEGLERDSEAS